MESGIGVKALTVAEAEAARDVDKVVGAYTRLYRRGYADGYADAKKGNPSHVVDAEAAAIGESISLDRTDTERLEGPSWDVAVESGEGYVLVTQSGGYYHIDGMDSERLKIPEDEQMLGDLVDLGQRIIDGELRLSDMSADAGTAEGHGKEASDGSTGRG